MRSIAVMNQKGGVGKTTTAVNLSAALAQLGLRVCLIDLDPQAHASLHLGLDLPGEARSIYDVLCGQAALAEVRAEIEPHLWLVGSSLDLAAAEVELAGESGRETILRQAIAADAAADFDYLVIDCPPSLGILTLNALTAVDEVLIPLQPHFLALHGLSKLLETIDRVQAQWNPRLRLHGVVLCLYDAGTRLAVEVSADVAAFFERSQGQSPAWSAARLFNTRIRRNIRLAESPSFGQSIFAYAAASHGAEDYLALARELHGQALSD